MHKPMTIRELRDGSFRIPSEGTVHIYPSVELYKLLNGKRIVLTRPILWSTMRDNNYDQLGLVAELVDAE